MTTASPLRRGALRASLRAAFETSTRDALQSIATAEALNDALADANTAAAARSGAAERREIDALSQRVRSALGIARAQLVAVLPAAPRASPRDVSVDEQRSLAELGATLVRTIDDASFSVLMSSPSTTTDSRALPVLFARKLLDEAASAATAIVELADSL